MHAGKPEDDERELWTFQTGVEAMILFVLSFSLVLQSDVLYPVLSRTSYLIGSNKLSVQRGTPPLRRYSRNRAILSLHAYLLVP
jgi:hypothetical protein